MSRVRSLVAASIALLVLALPASAGSGFGDPKRIDGLQVEADPGGPAVAIKDGKLFVAVAGGAHGKRGIYLLTNASGEWVRQRITDKRDFQPTIAVAGGAVHIAFYRKPDGPCAGLCSKGIFYARIASGVVLVERVHRGEDFHPSIDVGTGQSIGIAFNGNGRGTGDSGLYFASPRPGGGWQNAFLTNHCCGPQPDDGPSLQMRGSSAFMALQRPSLGQNSISLVILSDDTVDTLEFSSFPDARDPDLVLTPGSLGQVAFMRDNGLWFASIDKMGDSFQQKIAGVAAQGEPAITVVEGDRVAIIAKGQNGLIFRTNLDGTFGGSVITHQPGDRAPDIVANDAGKSRVVFVRDVDLDSPDRVWVIREQ